MIKFSLRMYSLLIKSIKFNVRMFSYYFLITAHLHFFSSRSLDAYHDIEGTETNELMHRTAKIDVLGHRISVTEQRCTSAREGDRDRE
jgi:hypothetical protein